MEIQPASDKDEPKREIHLSPWKYHFSKQFENGSSTTTAVPLVEGYLPGAAKNRLSINEGENSESTRRQREASIREGTLRRESVKKGESRRFSFMSSSAEFNKLLIESQQNNSEKKDKKRKPRANKRDRLSSGTFSHLENKHAILSTYINTEAPVCGKTGLYGMLVFGAILFIVGFVIGMGLLPMYVDDIIKKKLIVTSESPCFSSKDAGMCPGSVQAKYFLWNITNPNEYLQGSQAPKLEEIGPFAYNTYEKVYNAQFSENKTLVDYEYTYFFNYSAPDSCDACQNLEDMTIYTVNSAYLQALNQAGGSETSLIMAFLPQVFSGLFDGLKFVVSTVAPPNATDAELEDLVLGQWANCSVLGDLSVSTIPAYQENDPFVPEVGAWKKSNIDNTSAVSGLSVNIARKIFGKETAVNPADPFPDALSFIGAALMLPESAFSAASGIPSAQVGILKGYLYTVIDTYGKATLAAIVGPPLGDTSTGVIIKRNAKDLLEGWQDPLLASLMPGMNLSYNLGFHTDLIQQIDEQMESGELDSSHLFVFRKVATTGKYNPSEIGEVKIYEGLREIQYGNGSEAVHGRSVEPATGYRFYNFRHAYNLTLFQEVVQRPLTFVRDEETSIIHKIDALHFNLDPNETVTCAVNETQCIYPSNIDGVWDISSVYLAQSVGSFPQWAHQSPLGEEDSVQLTFNPENKREWGMDIEPRMGIALKTVMPFQFNYFVAPTDVLHQSIWKPNRTQNGHSNDGTYIPAFYYDLMSEISGKDAFKLRKLLNLLKVITLIALVGLPSIGIVFVVYSAFKLFFSLETIEMNKKIAEKLTTRASTVKLNRDSFMKKAGKSHDVETPRKKDPLLQHHYSFTNSHAIPKNSIPGYNR